MYFPQLTIFVLFKFYWIIQVKVKETFVIDGWILQRNTDL